MHSLRIIFLQVLYVLCLTMTHIHSLFLRKLLFHKIVYINKQYYNNFEYPICNLKRVFHDIKLNYTYFGSFYFYTDNIFLLPTCRYCLTLMFVNGCFNITESFSVRIFFYSSFKKCQLLKSLTNGYYFAY